MADAAADWLVSLKSKAREMIAARYGGKDLDIGSVEQFTGGLDGKRVYVMTAVEKTAWNVPFRSIVLDEDGKEVNRADVVGGDVLVPVFDVPPVVDIGPGDDIPDDGEDDGEVPEVTIDPATNDLELDACETLTETITVTIPAGAAVSKADVYFLADTTGSMGTILAAVRTGTVNILNALDALGLDIVYGVGNYKDFPNDPYAFQHQLSPTNVAANVQTAINAWAAGGGWDTPEGNLFALDQLAEPPGGTIGWRTGSKRIIVWIGDAPGHEVVCQAISGLAYDITEASVTTKLQNENITVVAISTGTGPGLDADPVPLSNDYNAACGAPAGGANQATNITAATGGQHIVGINAGNIVTTIVNLVQAAIATINSVTLVPTGAIAPFVTSITPASYGPLDGNRDHVLTFVVTFTGGAYPCRDVPQVFEGTIDVVIDGVVRARKPTRITEPPCGFTYSVKFVCGTQEQCECLCSPVRPGVYATEINIHNPQCVDARVDRRIVPLVRAGDVIGRDPAVSAALPALPPLTLPAHAATMEDCCWIQEHLVDTPPSSRIPLTVGFIEIRSSVRLTITAVYTVSDLKGRSVDIDVETIQPTES